MPSDDRALAALDLIAAPIGAYTAAVKLAAERVDSYLATLSADEHRSRAATELGAYAADRIDVERFAALGSGHDTLDDMERALLWRAREILGEHHALDASRFLVDVPTGGRLNLVLANTFAELGTPFGATRVAELIRGGRYDAAEHAVLFHGLPRHEWNRAERSVAPPLVVAIDGADLWAGEAAQYLDGVQKIVFVVRAPAPPVLVARLITPGTLIAQTTKPDAVANAMGAHGPVVVALMPEGCGAAEFIHVPDARLALHERITVQTPASGSRKTVPSWSTWQQDEEVRHLLAMATAPVAIVGTAAPSAGDPADRLAAWLLSHADLAAAG